MRPFAGGPSFPGPYAGSNLQSEGPRAGRPPPDLGRRSFAKAKSMCVGQGQAYVMGMGHT